VVVEVPTAPSCNYSAQVSRRRRNENMCSCRRRSASDGDWMCQSDVVVSAPPPVPYVNNYDGSNPLGIQAAPTRSENYFLIIGDWAKAGGPGQCQSAVAEKMRQYVAKQKQAGKNLLAVLTVGDNFYWAGVAPGMWEKMWANVYGTNDPSSPLHQVPWLATLGNHDFGDVDPYAFCPDVSPFTAVNGQTYACQQLNADRNPTRPAGTEAYWVPDYSYHYEIPEADVEFIFVDTNEEYVNYKINTIGFHSAREKCGGQDVVATFLRRIRQSGEELLAQRGASAWIPSGRARRARIASRGVARSASLVHALQYTSQTSRLMSLFEVLPATRSVRATGARLPRSVRLQRTAWSRGATTPLCNLLVHGGLAERHG